MESLYALTVDGTTVYYKGDISQQRICDIEHISQQIRHDNPNENLTEICSIFVSRVQNDLGIQLIPVPISYMFRI